MRRRYELPEGEVTPARILALADEVEARIEGGPAPRPLMRCSGGLVVVVVTHFCERAAA